MKSKIAKTDNSTFRNINIIIKVFLIIAIIGFLFGSLTVDSQSKIPLIVLIISSSWIALCFLHFISIHFLFEENVVMSPEKFQDNFMDD